MTLLKRIRAIDHRLTGPGSARTLTQGRTALVLVIVCLRSCMCRLSSMP